MATYQTLYEILKTKVPGSSTMSLPELVEAGRSVVFDFTYPMVEGPQQASDDYKQYFETEFLIKYLTREINRPNFDLWELKLYGVLNNIMPRYCQLIESEKWFSEYITNPSANTDYEETYTRKIDSESSTSTGATIKATTDGNGTATSNGSTTDTTQTTDKTKVTSSTDSENSATNTQTGENSSGTTGSQFPQTALDELTDFATDRSISTSTSKTGADSTSIGSTSTTTANTQNTESTVSSNTNSTDTTTSTTNSSSKSTTSTDDTGNSTETYSFRRVGNIGVQTPGEVFTNTRKAFINTLDDILNDKLIRQLFLQVGGDIDDELNLI